MAKGNDIQDRLIKFGARIIKVCNALPDNKAGKHVAGQLLRSGTSPAPNYGEARAAESKKIGSCHKSVRIDFYRPVRF